jgi:hypothetical protein
MRAGRAPPWVAPALHSSVRLRAATFRARPPSALGFTLSTRSA